MNWMHLWSSVVISRSNDFDRIAVGTFAVRLDVLVAAANVHCRTSVAENL